MGSSATTVGTGSSQYGQFRYLPLAGTRLLKTGSNRGRDEPLSPFNTALALQQQQHRRAVLRVGQHRAVGDPEFVIHRAGLADGLLLSDPGRPEGLGHQRLGTGEVILDAGSFIGEEIGDDLGPLHGDLLTGLRDRYEAHHRVSITDAAVVAAATLADRYINDRFLPDKAIDLIDEAGARMRIRRMTAPPDLREFDEKIADARREKESAIDAQDFEKAASLRDREKTLVAQRAEREKQWRSGDLDVVSEVDDEQIAEVLGNWTGIPVFKLTEEETTRLLRMEDELHKRIIGQEDAVKAVSKAIRRTRAGLKDPKRPSGSFIFAGPSGVGKTELSKALAEFLFGDSDALIQIDMGEFHDRFTASRLFGAPPGYVGYEEGGQLTEKVRRKPFSVVLFDEIEKAHQEIYNTLLQVLEDGRLTDGQGRTVDFKNTVLIFTSNLGTSDISKAVGLGFTQGGGDNNYERMKQKVNDELKKHFRPEFLNRIDDIIVFHQLTQDEIIQMVDLMAARVSKQLAAKDMEMELTDKAKSLLSRRGFDPVLGARPLRRTIQREIEDALSEKILFDEIRPGQLITVDVENWDGEGVGEDAKFTFSGGPKREIVEPDLAAAATE